MRSLEHFAFEELVPSVFLIGCPDLLSYYITTFVSKPVEIFAINDTFCTYLLQLDFLIVVLIEILFEFVSGTLLDEGCTCEVSDIGLNHIFHNGFGLFVLKLVVNQNSSY